MKKKRILGAVFGVIMGICVGFCELAIAPVTALAAKTASVNGIVESGTNSTLLKLNISDGVSEGTMLIKLDPSTDTSECHLLIPGKRVFADLVYGTDSYWHASKLSTQSITNANSGNVKVSTVNAYITDKPMENDVLPVELSTGGTMLLKIDSNTAYEGGVLYPGKSVTIDVYRGDDAYMHAATFRSGSGADAASTVTGAKTEYTSSTYSGSTTAVNGIVGSDTKAGKLFLKASEGTYELKLDAGTSYANGFMLVPGCKITANIYRGNDAYMHAAFITRQGALSDVASSDGSTQTFSGKVTGDSTDSVIFLNTSGGVMQFRIDANTTSNGPVFKGATISINGAVCSDHYWHAKSITVSASDAATGGSAGASNTSYSAPASTTPVTGKVTGDTTENILYLKSSDGTYSLKFDGNTNFNNGYILTPGSKITANIYRGDDAYMHVASITRADELSNTTSGDSKMTFTGTVTGESTAAVLVLKTSGGNVQIRLDSNTSYNGNKPLIKGASVTAECVNGADHYWHASSLNAN